MMESTIRAKLEQNQNLRRPTELVNTGDKNLVNCRIAKRSIAPPMLVTSLTAHVGPTNIVNTAVINMSDSMEIADGCSNFSPGRGSADLSSPGNLCEMLEYRYSKRHGENSKSERCSSRYFRSIFAVYPYTSPTSKTHAFSKGHYLHSIKLFRNEEEIIDIEAKMYRS